MSRHVMSCDVMSCHVMSCHVMSCHVMSRHLTSRHVMSCHVMSCHVVPWARGGSNLQTVENHQGRRKTVAARHCEGSIPPYVRFRPFLKFPGNFGSGYTFEGTQKKEPV